MLMNLVTTVLLIATIATWLLDRLWRKSYTKGRDWIAFPAVEGSWGPFRGLRAAIRDVGRIEKLVVEGTEKYGKKGQAFRIPIIGYYCIIVPYSLYDEVRHAKNKIFRPKGPADDFLQVRYTMSSAVHLNNYHVTAIRQDLTRNLPIPALVDEIRAAMKDYFPRGESWAGVSTYQTVLETITREVNRVVVGLPLCRDDGYLKACRAYVGSVLPSALVLRGCVGAVKGLVYPLLPVRKAKLNMEKFVSGLIKQRLETYPYPPLDGQEEPNDILQHLIRHSHKSSELTTPSSVFPRLLSIQFAVLHTTTVTFTQALFDLATNPECIAELREEVERVLSKEEETEEGRRDWTRGGVGELRKIDSFLKESMRLHPLSASLVRRKVSEDLTFTTGLTIPKGTFMELPAYTTHRDPELYGENSMEFSAFRFVERECDGESGGEGGSGGSGQRKEGEFKGNRGSLSYATNEFLGFGHGVHSCPGRFFASALLKIMLAEFVLKYDVKPLEKRPTNWMFMGAIVPDMKAILEVRKRQ